MIQYICDLNSTTDALSPYIISLIQLDATKNVFFLQDSLQDHIILLQWFSKPWPFHMDTCWDNHFAGPGSLHEAEACASSDWIEKHCNFLPRVKGSLMQELFHDTSMSCSRRVASNHERSFNEINFLCYEKSFLIAFM